MAALLLAALVPLSAAWAGVPLAPKPIQICVGAFGFRGLPVVQQDAGAGALYGLKAKALLFGPLGAEASYTHWTEGDAEFTAQGRPQKIEGGTQTATALNAILKGPGLFGLGIYFTGGIGTYKLEKKSRDDITHLGYNGGAGLELKVPMGLSAEAGGRLHVVPMKEGGARKFAALMIGVNYYIL